MLLLYRRWGLRLICSFQCGLLCSQTLGACRRVKPGVLAAIHHPGRCPGFGVPKSWWQSNLQLEENKAASPLRFLEKWRQVCALPLEGEAVFIVGQNFAFQHLAKEFTGDRIPS